ncbi:hypothetical protein QYE76_053346 [Lolium multiflorum]|uniref:Reverse transcriptase domain-containing protein n=1 Tax=Lolium multiflorum TaxID=4521 RepID=A0AAD8SVU4_LOLMU|nr:hypothetical protein QYE76_053346 [Lolium multiflorum]
MISIASTHTVTNDDAGGELAATTLPLHHQKKNRDGNNKRKNPSEDHKSGGNDMVAMAFQRGGQGGGRGRGRGGGAGRGHQRADEVTVTGFRAPQTYEEYRDMPCLAHIDLATGKSRHTNRNCRWVNDLKTDLEAGYKHARKNRPCGKGDKGKNKDKDKDNSEAMDEDRASPEPKEGTAANTSNPFVKKSVGAYHTFLGTSTVREKKSALRTLNATLSAVLQYVRELAEHYLNINPGAKPVKQAVRRFGDKKRRAIGMELANLNKHCPKDSFPLPRIDQVIDSTTGEILLCFLDAYSGYHRVRMKKSNQKAASFITPFGTYCYVTMLFCLKNAGATYQRTMQRCLKDQIERNVHAYVDDIAVMTQKGSDLISDLKETFENLWRKRTPDDAEELLAKIGRNHDDWSTPEPTPTPIVKKRGMIKLNDEDMREAKKSLKEKGIKPEDVKNLPPIEELCEITPPSSMIEDPLYPEGHPKRVEQDSQLIKTSAPSKKKKKKHKNVVESSEPVNDPNSISISDAETESGNEHEEDNDKNDTPDKEEIEKEPEKPAKNKKYTKEDFITEKHGPRWINFLSTNPSNEVYEKFGVKEVFKGQERRMIYDQEESKA